MNPQTPSPSNGQPTEPLPQPDNQQPAGPPPPSGPAPAQPTEFFPWIRSHGIHRGSDRWIGGVASGIAHRLGVDPLIIRGIFIVLTLFAGIGVLAYGVAWAFLPEPDGRIHVQEAGAGRWSSGMTGALVATIVGLTGLGGGFWGWSHNGFGGFLWTVFWVGAAVYLVYYLSQRTRGTRPAMAGQPADGTTGPYGTDYGTAGTSSFAAAGTAYGSSPASGSMPSYGGGSVAPPQAPKSRPAGPGAPAVAITAGAALLVGGGLKALDTGNVITLGGTPNAIVWASAAAVLGLGILVSGIRGRTSGLLSLFAVTALIAGALFTMAGNGERLRFQRVTWAPASIAEARDGFDMTAGRGTVDLTSLAAGAPLPSDVVVPLDITASNVTVVIPDNVPVDIKADMTMGNLNEVSGQRGGTTTRESSYNTDEPGSRLVVQIDGTFSNVTIEEGNAR